MCKEPYDAKFVRGMKTDLCPRFFVTAKDGTVRPNRVTVSAHQTNWTKTDIYESLPEMWNEYYRQYMEDADYPRLIVRYEDFLLYSQEIVRVLAECSGAKMTSSEFHYFTGEARSWRKQEGTSNIINTVKKLGAMDWFYYQLTKEEQQVLQSHLSPDIRALFQYDLTYGRPSLRR